MKSGWALGNGQLAVYALSRQNKIIPLCLTSRWMTQVFIWINCVREKPSTKLPPISMASPSQSSSSHQQSSLPRLLQVTAGGNIRGGRNKFSFNFFQESCHFLSCLFRKCYFLLLICFHFLFLNSYPSFCFKHYKTKYSWIFHLCRN